MGNSWKNKDLGMKNWGPVLQDEEFSSSVRKKIHLAFIYETLTNKKLGGHHCPQVSDKHNVESATCICSVNFICIFKESLECQFVVNHTG